MKELNDLSIAIIGAMTEAENAKGLVKRLDDDLCHGTANTRKLSHIAYLLSRADKLLSQIVTEAMAGQEAAMEDVELAACGDDES